ncbi:hypothetical protein [Alteromonas facilis]|uniref:hypothetical protein n=1 Tax=Alteromonas facilis TaxID=2048004 RepID=UPI000C289CDC|nr:hypothetical protein [Alteromonas facilis]
MRTVFRTLLLLAGVSLILLVVLGFVLTDAKPSVADSGLQGLDDAESVTELLHQLQTSVIERDAPHTIVITRAQANSLVAFLERAKPQVVGRVQLSESETELQLSYQLQKFGLTRYVNLHVAALPDNKLTFKYVRVGSLSLPGDWALSLVTFAVDYWTSSDIATFATEQVSSIKMTNDAVQVQLRPLEGLLKELTELQNGLNIDQDEWLSERTAFYLRFLARFSVNNEAIYNDPEPSLAPYLQAVISHAMNNAERSAAEENEAALLALTVFAGHHRFGNLVGQVQSDPARAVRPPHPTRLAGRLDLSQHFIISAGLKLLSEQGITNAIGEFKELMDRVMGGSGYSFVDLAADIAGVEFAALAIDPEQAAAVQRYIANGVNEEDFFPSIEGLPEGLDKTSFTERYESVESEVYQQQVAEVKKRVASLPIYQALSLKGRD